MAKKKKFRDKFDSPEEWHFSLWLDQLKEAGYILEYQAHPEPFPLFEGLNHNYIDDKEKNKTESILQSHSYGADFLIVWDGPMLFHKTLNSVKRLGTGNKSLNTLISQCEGIHDEDLLTHVSYVEIKPSFDKHNMTRIARAHQQWVYAKYGTFVNIVTPTKHFEKTFTPDRYFYTDMKGSTNTRTLKYKSVLTMDEFIQSKHKLNEREDQSF